MSYEGYVKRKSGKHKKWKKIYCSVKRGKIFFTSTKPSSVSSLSKGLRVYDIADFQIRDPPSLQTFSIIAKTPPLKEIFIKAPNLIARKKFLKALKTYSPVKSEVKDEEDEPDGIRVVCSRKDGKIVSWKGPEISFGYRSGKLVGHKISNILAADMANRFLTCVKLGMKEILTSIPNKTTQIPEEVKIHVISLRSSTFTLRIAKSVESSCSPRSRREYRSESVKTKLSSAKDTNIAMSDELCYSDLPSQNIRKKEIDAVETKQPDSTRQDPNLLYQRTHIIGQGFSATVYLGKHIQSGNLVAIKVLKTPVDIERVNNEINMLKEVNSEFCVKYYATFICSSQSWIVMEYCDVGSLGDLVKTVSLIEPAIKLILYKVLRGIHYLHKGKLIHRDIKGLNVLLKSNGECKLTDFGFSTKLLSSVHVRNTTIGSPYWMAPEISEETGYNQAIDIWSLGITAIECAEGKPPHYGKTPIKALYCIQNSPPPRLSEPDRWSPQLFDFVSVCCTKDPSLRPSAQHLLKHDLFKHLPNDEILVELFSQNIIDLEAYEKHFGSVQANVWKQNRNFVFRKHTSLKSRSPTLDI